MVIRAEPIPKACAASPIDFLQLNGFLYPINWDIAQCLEE